MGSFATRRSPSANVGIVNGLRLHVQRRLVLGLICGFAAFHARPGIAFAADGDEVSPAALVAARELFREATDDVDAGRFAQALDKFKRVASVKETPAVRFNVGRCEESLGRTGAALADFELAEREAKLDPKGEEIEKLSRDRAATLRPKVPRLTVASPAPAVPGLTVMLDGARLTPASLGVALPVDPGEHVIEATAPGRAPFHAKLVSVAGEAKQVRLDLAEGSGGDPNPPDDTPHPGRARRTWGWITVGGGVALGGVALTFLVLHNSAVNEIIADCKPTCGDRTANTPRLQALSDRANFDQGVAIGFAAASAVALGVGAYLVLSAPSSSSPPAAWLSPSAPGAPAGLTLHASF